MIGAAAGHSNPALTRYEGPDRTRRSTCGSALNPNSPLNVPLAIRNLISELGLRYRPTSQTDLSAHAGALALLGRDLADMPPDLLSRAIEKWVTSSPFMPKASDLIGIAKSLAQRTPKFADGETLADRYNRRLTNDPAARLDIRWCQDGDNLWLDWTR